MTIRSKTLFIIASVVALSVLLNYAVLKTVVYPSFVKLENAEAGRNIARVQDALGAELERIGTLNADWSSWDDTYQYASDRNTAYEESNFFTEAATEVEISVFYVYDASGDVLWATAHDLATGEELSKDNFELSDLDPSHFLFQHAELGSPDFGVMRTVHGPMLYASSAILTSDAEGPSRGTFVMGRFITPGLVETLVARTHVDLEIMAVESGSLSPTAQSALEALAGDDHAIHLQASENVVSTFAVFADATGLPTLLLRADTPRDISAIGQNTIKVTLIGLIVTGLVVLTVLGLLIARTVIGPLSSFTFHLLRIRRSGDLAKSIDMNRTDEIGLLAIEFNSMLKETHDAQRRLSEHAFHSGMAEMAAGLLHNLRNQVQPLVLRTSRLQQLSSQSPGEEIDKAIEELAEGSASSDRREKLIKFVGLWKDSVINRQKDSQEQLQKMATGLSSLDSMLDEQDALTRGELKIDAVNIAALVQEASQAIPEFETDKISVRVDPDLENLKSAHAERFLLKQAMISVLKNAAEAMEDKENAEVRIGGADWTYEGRPGARITIADNGKGISTDHLERVFERGFSTKKGKKRGLGLHWCANALRGMNGAIEIESDGAGQGTKVQIFLPLEAAISRAA